MFDFREDNTCQECFKEFNDSDFNKEYGRCSKCLDLKYWECKECNADITVVEFDRNGGKCNDCK